jgi:hypothetical protein
MKASHVDLAFVLGLFTVILSLVILWAAFHSSAN